MTNNEKAATFIGWRHKECSICETAWSPETVQISVHMPMCSVRAPDMSKPENYMRALQALPADLMWNLGIDPYGYPYCNIMSRMYGVQDTRGRGHSVMDALAALYDWNEQHGDGRLIG